MQRLDLNLSTRPFRNNTLIWTSYGVALTLLLGFAAWNGMTYYRHLALLDEKKSHLEDLASQQSDLERRELIADRQRQRRELGLTDLTVQSLKANEVIEWKAFSWTELFNRLETALPWNVYMTAVRPVFRGERGNKDETRSADVRRRPVSVEGYAKSLTALLDFERKLFASEYFDDPEPLRHAPDDRGDLIFTMRFTYYPDGRPRQPVIEEDGGEDGGQAGGEPGAETGADVAADVAEKAAREKDTAAEPSTDAGVIGDSIGTADPPTIKRASEKAGGKPPAAASSKKPAAQEVRP